MLGQFNGLHGVIRVKRTIIRRPEVEKRTGLTCSGFYEAMLRDEFPKSVPIGRYAVGWVEDEVNAWIEERIEARARAKT